MGGRRIAPRVRELQLRATIDGNPSSSLAPNTACAPHITDVVTHKGGLSPAVIMDRFSPQVRAARCSRIYVVRSSAACVRDRGAARGPLPAQRVRGVDRLQRRRQPTHGGHLRTARAGFGMRGSMIREDKFWDNAPTRSLGASLKVRRSHGRRCRNRHDAMDEIVDGPTFRKTACFSHRWAESVPCRVRGLGLPPETGRL